MDGLAAARAHGRAGGRPSALDADKLAAARARQERGESITAIAKHLGVGRSTLYRALEKDDRPAAAATNAAPVWAVSILGRGPYGTRQERQNRTHLGFG
ncbi:helix-turn-helix domain-containing protein [Nonomuraea dietziae]|uniref:helix-turn-helix domain-containing protein n=1 Tax=Nonomuraea dietziae TaxID=65515 RepID=UPI00331DEBEA